ncbi:MAG: sigma-70 family RNA polymerase sigma factor [Planctomycetes bacterium]|nr:sigma-70 family RNA polymerase sigma factor [Planctomycetota bacterium]
MAIEAPPDGLDDAILIRRIVEMKDEDALRVLLRRYAGKVTGYLISQFRYQLRRPDVDEIVNIASLKVFEKAHQFDFLRQGGFGPWYLQIAHNSALDFLKGEEEPPEFEPGVDPADRRYGESMEPSPQVQQRIAMMDHFIEHELKGLEQKVARADLAVGGSADSASLAERNQTSVGVIHTTRNRVRKKLRTNIEQLESQRARKKG